jgi:hypothetical protein
LENNDSADFEGLGQGGVPLPPARDTVIRIFSLSEYHFSRYLRGRTRGLGATSSAFDFQMRRRMAPARIFTLLLCFLLTALYLSFLFGVAECSSTKGSSGSKRTTPFYQTQEPIPSHIPPAPIVHITPPPIYSPVERTFGEGLLYPPVVVGTFLPVAVLIGIGIILSKLFAIGIWALKSQGGLGGGGIYPGFGGGGFGGGFPGGGGFGGYGGGGYGGGGGGYGGFGGGYGPSGWRSEQGFGRMMDKKDGSSISPFISETALHVFNMLSSALDKYSKKPHAEGTSSTPPPKKA